MGLGSKRLGRLIESVEMGGILALQDERTFRAHFSMDGYLSVDAYMNWVTQEASLVLLILPKKLAVTLHTFPHSPQKRRIPRKAAYLSV